MCATCESDGSIIVRQFTSLMKDQANMVTGILISGHLNRVRELSTLELESAISRIWRESARESQ